MNGNLGCGMMDWVENWSRLINQLADVRGIRSELVLLQALTLYAPDETSEWLVSQDIDDLMSDWAGDDLIDTLRRLRREEPN